MVAAESKGHEKRQAGNVGDVYDFKTINSQFERTRNEMCMRSNCVASWDILVKTFGK